CLEAYRSCETAQGIGISDFSPPATAMAAAGSPPLVGASPLLSLLAPPRKRAAMPRVAASASARARPCPYRLKEGQFRRFHRLPSGLAMEVIFQEAHPAVAEEGLRNPPLVFIHGSFHAAWCWVEHWLPFFSDSGYDCHALSLLGQVNHLRCCLNDALFDKLRFRLGSGLVRRYLLTKPIAAIKYYRYQELMKASSKLPLFDLRKLNASLPVSPPAKGTVKLLIMGASDDFIVDTEGLQETARFYGVQAVCVEGVAHDMMLDTTWEKGAQTFLSWLQELQRYQVP
ncbi:hypothetical protein GW17_00013598, partial [Ensete ventricosum]